jgi:Tfp pilus assembly protein PilV
MRAISQRRGFLLLEAMLAVAIFAIAMLALGRCVQNCLRAEKFRREEGLAQRALANYWVQVENGAIPLTDKATEELKGAYTGMTMNMTRTPMELRSEKDQELFGLFEVNLELVWKVGDEPITRSMNFILYPRQK